MSFDTRKFEKANFEHSTKDVLIEELNDFFPDEKEPIFTVRGLSHAELIEISEIQNKDNNLRAMIEGALSNDPSKKTEAIQKLLGNTGELPVETRSRIETVRMGLVSPALDTSIVARLAEFFPVQFNHLWKVIDSFTAEGALVAKKKR